MARKTHKRPHIYGVSFWIVFFLLVGAFSALWWLWPCLSAVSPQFNSLLLEKDGNPLRILNRDSLQLHPRDRVRILEISTNICFNRGVRLAARKMDVEALLYETLPVSVLLPKEDLFDRHEIRVRIMQYTRELGYVDLTIQPQPRDWIARAERIIDPERKVAFLERAAERHPDHRKIQEALLKEYKALQRWSQAAELIESMSREKGDEKLLFELLEVVEAMSDLDGTISVLKRILEGRPEDLELRSRLATTLEKAGKPDQAIDQYEKILAQATDNEKAALCKKLGYLYTETGKPTQAIAAYLKAVEVDREDANVLYNLSALYEKTGQKEKADHFLGKAVRLRSDDLDSRLKLAESLLQEGKGEAAEEHLSQVLEKKPDSLAALALMVRVMEARGEKQALQEVYKKILALEPGNETVVYNLAVLEYEAGKLAESERRFQEYLKVHPGDADAHEILFDIYRKQKKNELAFKEARTLAELTPDNIALVHHMVEYLNGRGDYPGIIETCQKGLKSHPKDPALREYLILAYLKTQQEDKALKEMETLLLLKPGDLELRLQLAKLQEKRGLGKEALENYGKILEASPHHGDAEKAIIGLLLNSAKEYERGNEIKKALRDYKRVLEISPGHEEAEEAYLRLRLRVLPQGGE
ncbi:MAG: tetratricopeptide repeat protein [Deltaproteobacteria bacterium]|nr:tetratricopeptide repeat protein [Deltaproteobacteria bacterium]